MLELLQRAELTLPLFVLIAIGYLLMRCFKWPQEVSDALTRFVFSVALPALLFSMMSDLSQLPPVDMRLLIAFFGSCLVVFALGRLLAARLFHLDGVSGSVFALGGVFSNNAMLGIPMAKALLGPAALPSVALVLVFNALILWTLVTISVEWARHGSLSLEGFTKTAWSVITNPLVAAIVAGTIVGLTGVHLPTTITAPLTMISQAAAPMSLIALGMGLAEFGIRAGWQQSVAICVLKLVMQPLVIWLIARALGLPLLETQVVVLLGSIAVGANVYLMSRHFRTMEGPIAASLVLSTVLSAISTPVALTLISLSAP
ncbi:AEC family transporter [Uliginosibacterium sp. H3]|uniref:AEC family transporter n=1 Tax=Uliginosibacterium silvisoli TaxID=3114758 RepID=A0ABU6K8Y0_9RHOO|nr:AEC family transporter [Uliginosibacterium sp. H3]